MFCCGVKLEGGDHRRPYDSTTQRITRPPSQQVYARLVCTILQPGKVAT